jgi:hypothetical protein
VPGQHDRGAGAGQARVSHRDEHDGRVVRIEATPQAIDTLDRLRASWSDLISAAWGDDVTDLDPVITRLDALLNHLADR